MAKPRDVFFMTLSKALLLDMPSGPDYDDMLQTMEDIEVHVLERGSPIPPATPVYVPIFQSGNLGEMAQGPTSASGAKIPDAGGNNPFRTGPSGNIEFWVEGPREVDVYIHDIILPSRVADRTFGWNATAVGAESLPTSMLVKDQGLTMGSMSPVVVQQMVPIGAVIDWWRPAATVPIPAGFEICDGHQVTTHEFGTGAPINVPDLRNTFILGALPDTADVGRAGAPTAIAPVKPQAGGSGQGNAAGDAPGIAGTGGSNLPKNFGHGHGVPGVDHAHFTSTPDHYHHVGGLYGGGHAHAAAMGTATRGSPNGYSANSAQESVAFTNHIHGVWTGDSGAVGIGGQTGGSQHALGAWSGGANVGLGTATNSLTWTADPGGGGLVVDVRPKFIGLLKIMKVRRT